MEDLIETAIEKILISAGGDMRQALRALLIENIKLQSELSRRDNSPARPGGAHRPKTLLH
jgi:hypothetical protein